jgi:hypothetical protein
VRTFTAPSHHSTVKRSSSGQTSHRQPLALVPPCPELQSTAEESERVRCCLYVHVLHFSSNPTSHSALSRLLTTSHPPLHHTSPPTPAIVATITAEDYTIYRVGSACSASVRWRCFRCLRLCNFLLLVLAPLISSSPAMPKERAPIQLEERSQPRHSSLHRPTLSSLSSRRCCHSASPLHPSRLTLFSVISLVRRDGGHPGGVVRRLRSPALAGLLQPPPHPSEPVQEGDAGNAVELRTRATRVRAVPV